MRWLTDRFRNLLTPGFDPQGIWGYPLSRIPWLKLRAVYGSAREIPGQLQRLGSSSIEERHEALSCLKWNLAHQGWAAEAALPVLPFLFEAVAHPACDEQADIIDLLRLLIVGLDEEFPGPLGNEIYLKRWPELYLETNRRLPRLFPWIASVPHFFGYFPDWKEQTLPCLRLLATSPYDSIRCASYFARGLLGDNIELETEPGDARYFSALAYWEASHKAGLTPSIVAEMLCRECYREHPWPFDLIGTNYAACLAWRKSPFDVRRIVRAIETIPDRNEPPQGWESRLEETGKLCLQEITVRWRGAQRQLGALISELVPEDRARSPHPGLPDFPGFLKPLGDCHTLNSWQSYLFAWYPEQRRHTLPLLRRACLRGRPGDRAAAWIARGLLQDVEQLERDPHETIALAQAIGLCESGRAGSEALGVIADLVEHPESDCLNNARQPFWNQDLVGYGRSWLARFA